MSPRRPHRARLLLVSCACVLWAACRIGNPRPELPSTSTWRLVLEEEFEGAAGQPPSPQRWRYDVGGDGWGNAQLEHNTNRTENVSLDGQGHLAITARREAFQGNAYTSGRILTKGLFTHQYGRFEARIRLPSGRGLWPAFWMLGANFDTVGWPECGELDLMEYRGQEPGIVLGSMHGPGYSGGAAVSGRYILPNGGRFDTDFHVFAIEWTSEQVTWFVDGQPYQVVTRSQVPGRWVFDQPFFILLNVAVGGNFLGPPDASTTFPQQMLVDYVRVYEGA